MTSLEIIFISKYLHFLLEKYKISLKTPQKAAIYVFFFYIQLIQGETFFSRFENWQIKM